MASSVARMPAGDLLSPATSAHRRQSQILDRWAARQAREMITTIERRRHEAELSALSNVRASSLIQMWREMEAEASPRCGAASPPAEEASGGLDAESRGVGKMVRMMSLKISSWASSSSDESEVLTVAKKQLEHRPMPATLPTAGGGGKVVRVRGRKEIEGLVMRMKQERLREIAELAEKRKVSRFPFRGRIQPLIRLRSLRQEVATIKHQQRSINLEVEDLQKVSNSIFLREKVEDLSHNNVNGTKIDEHTTYSRDSDFAKFVDHSESEDTQYTELEFVWRNYVPAARLETEKKCHSRDDNATQQHPQIEKFDFHETEFHSHVPTSRQRPETTKWREAAPNKPFISTIESKSSPQAFHQGDILMEKTKTFTDLSRQTFADNVEIRELLERRIVSNIIASDFPHKMNQLINSFIQKQALQYGNENGRDGCEEERIWRQNNEDCSDQDFSTSFNQNSSSSERDENVLNDLRVGFTLMKSELSELRKLVESCLEWQQKMECGIKQEFSSAVDKLVERGKSSANTKWNGACCICCEAQIDTVLYRCGHMCACFKCSQGLQWSNGNCPICRSTIIDIVRVYF